MGRGAHAKRMGVRAVTRMHPTTTPPPPHHHPTTTPPPPHSPGHTHGLHWWSVESRPGGHSRPHRSTPAAPPRARRTPCPRTPHRTRSGRSGRGRGGGEEGTHNAHPWMPIWSRMVVRPPCPPNEEVGVASTHPPGSTPTSAHQHQAHAASLPPGPAAAYRPPPRLLAGHPRLHPEPVGAPAGTQCGAHRRGGVEGVLAHHQGKGRPCLLGGTHRHGHCGGGTGAVPDLARIHVCPIDLDRGQGGSEDTGYRVQGKVRGRCHVTAWLAAMIQNVRAAPQTTTACTVHGSAAHAWRPTPLVPTPFHLTSLHPGLHPESSRARGALLQHSRRPSPTGSWATQSLGTRAPCAHAGGAPSAIHTTVRAAPIPCPPNPRRPA